MDAIGLTGRFRELRAAADRAIVVGAGRHRSERVRILLIALAVLAVLGIPPLVEDVQLDPAFGGDSYGGMPSINEAESGQATALAPDSDQPSSVTAALAAAEEVAIRFSRDGLWGMALLDRETGDLALGRAGTQPVFAASLSKLVVAVDILDRRRTDSLVVGEPDIDRLRRALGPSDDGAMNALWSRFDGVGAIERVSARLELTETMPPLDPSQWGEVLISAADAAVLWQYVLDGMAAEDSDLLVSWMSAAPPIAADGFDQRFGLLDAADAGGARVAKQGWMCCHSGQFTLHSAGAFGAELRYVAAVLSKQPRTLGWALARQRVGEVATALIDAL